MAPGLLSKGSSRPSIVPAPAGGAPAGGAGGAGQAPAGPSRVLPLGAAPARGRRQGPVGDAQRALRALRLGPTRIALAWCVQGREAIKQARGCWGCWVLGTGSGDCGPALGAYVPPGQGRGQVGNAWRAPRSFRCKVMLQRHLRPPALAQSHDWARQLRWVAACAGGLGSIMRDPKSGHAPSTLSYA